MNFQDNRDNERRLQELEREINQSIPTIETRVEQPLAENANSEILASRLTQVANWFNSLPKPGKIVITIIAVLLGFSLLKSILQLVAALISLALLGVILYLGYKFLIAPKSAQ